MDHVNQIRHKYITELIKEYFLENEVDQVGQIVIFDTSYSWNDKNQYIEDLNLILKPDQKEKIQVIQNITKSNELIKSLLSLRDPHSPHNEKSSGRLPISLLIIDNLSTFYWSTKSQYTSIQEYAVLGSILRKTQKLLGCFIVTTSWDKKFNMADNPPDDEHSQKYTNIPKEFFQSVDHIYSLTYNIRGSQVTCKYLGKERGPELDFVDKL